MNRIEALRILGLDEDASADDIKAAYKEMAQILHPDRFASSKKLQDRATEQFKNLQEAYDLLSSGKAGRSSSSSKTSSGTRRGYSKVHEYEARLAGIAAARTQLVAQRDAVQDERRNGVIIFFLGVAVAVLLGRRADVAIALGSTAAIWGIVRVIYSQTTLNNLDGHIKKLNEEQKRIAQELDDLEEE